MKEAGTGFGTKNAGVHLETKNVKGIFVQKILPYQPVSFNVEIQSLTEICKTYMRLYANLNNGDIVCNVVSVHQSSQKILRMFTKHIF